MVRSEAMSHDRQSSARLVSAGKLSWAKKKTVDEARGHFGNPEEGKRPPLEAGTKQRLVKTQQTEKI
jgi:hypothetical protein